MTLYFPCDRDVVYILRVVTWGLSLATPNKSDGSLSRVTCSSRHPSHNHHHPLSPTHHLNIFPVTDIKTTISPSSHHPSHHRQAPPPPIHLSPPSPTDLGHRWKSLLRCVVHHYQGSKLSDIIFDIKVALASQSVPLLKTLQHFRCKTKGCCGHWLMPLLLSPSLKTPCRMAMNKLAKL